MALPDSVGAYEIKEALRITSERGYIGLGNGVYFVVLYYPQKRPPLIKWRGISIVYHIGGGIAVANAA